MARADYYYYFLSDDFWGYWALAAELFAFAVSGRLELDDAWRVHFAVDP